MTLLVKYVVLAYTWILKWYRINLSSSLGGPHWLNPPVRQHSHDFLAVCIHYTVLSIWLSFYWNLSCLLFVTLCVSYSFVIFSSMHIFGCLFYMWVCLLTLPCCQNPKCILKKECCSLYFLMSMLNAIRHYSFWQWQNVSFRLQLTFPSVVVEFLKTKVV